MRELLAAVQPSSLIRTEPGHVALLRSRVEAAGGDHEAVAAWVIEQGGYLGRTPDIERTVLGGARPGTRITPGEEFYAVPRSALAE